VCQASPIPTSPIHTNKTRFRIPYRYNAAEMQQLGAREIRLYVSLDRGVNWQHIALVAPDVGSFDFQATNDGEHWFAVRTVDHEGRFHPDSRRIEAGLKVNIDTTAPQFRISLRQMTPGTVQLSWFASDPYLDPTKLRLEYIQLGTSEWQQVGVDPRANGQTSWSVPQGGTVVVRGSISDKAANISNTQFQVTIEPANQAVPEPSIPDFHEPVAGHSTGRRTEHRQVLPDVAINTQIPPSRPTFAPNRSGVGLPNPSSSAHSENSTVSRNGFVSDAPGMNRQTAKNQPFQKNNFHRFQRPVSHHRVVNSGNFQIGYRIDDVGLSGVSQVELFITQNSGKKWRKYGDDLDRRSPFRVQVPDDGVYGFALRAHSGVGLSDKPPQAGEKPSIVVVVDQVPPHAELLPLQQGQGITPNKILIRWIVSDENPAKKPIALSYSTNGNGPWEPITDWQRDTGSFLWTVGPGIPSKSYVRLMTRDAAGNLAHVQTPQPVIIDLAKPSARIVNVELTSQF